MAKRPTTRPRGTRPANPRRPSRPSQRNSEPSTPAGTRRRWPVIVAIAAAITIVATAASALYLTRGAQEVTIDDAVDEFRSGSQVELTEEATPQPSSPAVAPGSRSESASAPKSSKPASAVPAPAVSRNAFVDPAQGVYAYATKGWEQTDALAGQRHDYPSETSYTIRKGGCGWTTRWQPLKERWEDSEFCETPQGARIKSYTMYHEFFRRGQREDFACDGYVHKKGDAPGDSWTFSCKSPRSNATSKVTVIGFETINVGGRPVKTIHLHYDVTAKGSNRGTITQDRWLSDSPRLMVRLIQKADLVTDSPFGPVGYKESFRMDLKSVDPKR